MRGHVRKRGTKWAVVVDIGRDANGKRQQRWHSGFDTRKAAEAATARIIRELDTGAYVAPSKITVAEFLAQWLKHSKSEIGTKTHERYSEIVDKHLVPAVGHHALTRLTPTHVQDHYATALDSGRLDGKGGLAPRTVLHHHRVLHTALEHAVRLGLLARNPTDATKPPRPDSHEIDALGSADMRRFLDATRSHPLHCIVLLAATTGMRRGELLALRWADVNLDVGAVEVRRSLSETKAGLAFKAPKTSKAERRVPLLPQAVTALRAHHAAQARERLAAGPSYDNKDLVFAEPDGSIVRPSRFSSRYKRLVVSVGFTSLRFHDLRHSHATLLFQEGVHPKVVSERLGHSNVNITLNTYTHVLPGMQEEAVARLANSAAFGGD